MSLSTSSNHSAHSQTACHRALLCTDILPCIFDSDDGPWFQGRRWKRDCINAALACRPFYEPASRLLWQNQEGLLPLWNILIPDDVPAIIPHTHRRSEDELGVYAKRLVQSERFREKTIWEIFMRCSARIQRLGVFGALNHWHGHFKPFPGELEMMRVLIDYNGGKTFLPRLQVLQWWTAFWDAPSDLTSFVLGALAFPLSSLHINLLWNSGGVNNADDPSGLTFLQSIFPSPSCAPSLGTLTLYSSGHCMPDTIVDMVCKYRRLHRVSTIHPWWWRQPALYDERPELLILTPSLIQALFSHLGLEELECWIDSEARGDKQVAIRAPCLKILKCKGTCIGYAEFLAATTAPHLTSIHFKDDFSSTLPLSHVRLLIRAMAAPQVSRSLRIVSLEIGQGWSLNGDEHRAIAHPIPTATDILAPLLSLSELTEFSIRIDSFDPLAISDTDILAITKAFPNLHELALRCAGTSTLGFLTPLAFVHVFRHCQKLLSLSLGPMDATGSSLQDVLPLPQRTELTEHPLRSWRGWEPIPVEDPVSLAGLLRELFPSLKLEDVYVEHMPQRRSLSLCQLEQEIVSGGDLPAKEAEEFLCILPAPTPPYV